MDEKTESNHDEKAKQDDKNKQDVDKSEQTKSSATPSANKDTVVFDVVQESRKDNEEALDPFFDDED